MVTPTTSGGPATLFARFWLGGVVAVVLVVVAVFWFRNAFHDRGYTPTQPIAFSHKLHAGDLKLDCRFCHFNAERGKHAGVPPMSVCMSCHSVVETDKPAIQQLAAINDSGSYTDAQGVVHEGGVVHWARVHKLPDHVYFNHAAHVAADVACQTCHGPVEQMVVMRQFATMNMSWCLDCHRKSNYVGGPGSDPKDPTTWRIGTADYAAVRDREEADPVVEFRSRQVKGQPAGDAHAEPAPAGGAVGIVPANAGSRLAEFLKLNPQFADKVKDLPAWRAADLPESHRLMNAATNCSTCHQ
jgi:hypothetical protein